MCGNRTRCASRWLALAESVQTVARSAFNPENRKFGRRRARAQTETRPHLRGVCFSSILAQLSRNSIVRFQTSFPGLELRESGQKYPRRSNWK